MDRLQVLEAIIALAEQMDEMSLRDMGHLTKLQATKFSSQRSTPSNRPPTARPS